MIRINLLPIKVDRRREAGRAQVLIALGIIGLEALGLFFVQMSINSKVDAQMNVNQRIQAKVDRIQKEIKDHDSILDEIAEFERREEAIANLQAARTGPVYALLEIAALMSKGGRPNIDHDKYQEMVRFDPTSGYDESWDYRRLWLDSIKEKSKEVRLAGQALTHEDVAEFLRRINLSSFFTSSELISTDVRKPALKALVKPIENSDPVVHFTIDTTVRYR